MVSLQQSWDFLMLHWVLFIFQSPFLPTAALEKAKINGHYKNKCSESVMARAGFQAELQL